MTRKGSAWNALDVRAEMKMGNARHALVGITWMKMGTATLDVMDNPVMTDCCLITMGVKVNALCSRGINCMSI